MNIQSASPSVRFGLDFARPPKTPPTVLSTRPKAAPGLTLTKACKEIAVGVVIGASIAGACTLVKDIFKGILR